MKRFLVLGGVYLAGIVTGILALLLLYSFSMKEKIWFGDVTQYYPEKFQKLIKNPQSDFALNWITNVKAIAVGKYSVITPRENAGANILITGDGNNPCPWVFYCGDSDGKGGATSVFVMDKECKVAVGGDVDANGIISSLNFTKDVLSSNAIYRIDYNLDGFWDVVSEPTGRIQLRVDGQLRDGIRSNNTYWIQTVTGLRKVIKTGNELKLKD